MTKRCTAFLAAVCWLASGLAALTGPGGANPTVPEFIVRNTRADEALDLLRHAAELASPDEDPLQVVYRPPAEDRELPRITASLRQISLLDAIRVITQAAGLVYRIDGNVVIISHETGPRGPIQRRMYSVTPGMLNAMQSRAENDAPEGRFFR